MNKSVSRLPVALQSRLYQIVLFAVIGVMNTAVDFAVLNLLIWLSHHDKGWWLIFFNCLSFLAAVINSYIFNGRLTFRHQGGDLWLFLRFVGVNAVGLAINSTVVWLMTLFLGHMLSSIVAINVGKSLAVLFSLCWNYFAIKRWIFTAKTAVVASSSYLQQQVAPLDLQQEDTMREQRVPIVDSSNSSHTPRRPILVREETQ